MSQPIVVDARQDLQNPNENQTNVAVLPFLPLFGNFLKDSIAVTDSLV